MDTSKKNLDEYFGGESSQEESHNGKLELFKPSTCGLKSEAYNVESSALKRSLHGLTYQLRLLMLSVQQVPDGQDFYLSTDMHEAGLFDDIVLKYLKDGIWRYRFIQGKHRNDNKFKIEIRDLFNKKPKSKKNLQSGDNKPYLLKKYFKSYCDIKKNPFFQNANLEEFLICSNVGFAENAMTYFKSAEENEDDSILENRVKYRLIPEQVSKLTEEFEINDQNENCFLNFVEKFRFLPNYEDNGFYENIQTCFETKKVDLAKSYIQNRVFKWLENYRDKKSEFLYIKDKKELLKSLNNNIESLLVTGYSDFNTEELKHYGVQFENTLPLREFFLRKKDKIMCIMTATPKLSMIKLNQVFSELELRQDEIILTNVNQLNYNQKIFTTFFAGPSYKWLVIKYHHNEIKLSEEILDKIFKMDEEKTVVIIDREDSVSSLNKCLRLNTTCFDEKNNLFRDLTIVSQKKILEKKIIFQGKTINLNELIDIYTGQEMIDQITLENLVTETIKIEDNAFETDFFIEDYYIKRKLIQRELRLDILQNEEVLKCCLFIISGINKDQLKNLKINEKLIFMWEDGIIFNNGIIISTTNESRDIFYKLCKDYTENVCWLEHIRGQFLIINISNDTDVLHKHFICLEEHDLHKKQILEKKIIIVADSPGCGKSMFLTRIAHQLKRKLSNIWVLRINLSFYATKQARQTLNTKSLNDIEFGDSETYRAIKFLACLLFPQEYKNQSKHFVRELLTRSLYCLKENIKCPKIILLFDGFDEISPILKEKTLTLLKALRNSNVVQMWITTSNHEEHSLRVALHSSSFFLKPLDFTEKVDFLQKLWKYKFINFDNIEPKPDSKDVSTYLTEITNNICNYGDKLISESFRNIQNHWLPTHNYSKLQLSLSSLNFSVIAKRLIQFLENFNLDKVSEFTANPLQLKMAAEVIVLKKFSSLDKLDIFSLYEEFIKYKWAVFYDEKSTVVNSVASRNFFEMYSENLKTVHQEIAFNSLFGPYDIEKFMKEPYKTALSRVGLLVIHDDRLEFVHRSFAEYFVSQYFAENFHSENNQKIVFSEVLIKENYSIMRKFLNFNTTFLHQLSSKTPQMNEIIKISCSNSNILYQMLQENLNNLFVTFLENLPLDFPKNAILCKENVDGATALHRICNSITDVQIENILKVLKDTVSSKTLTKLFFEKDNELRTPLHCINFGSNNSIMKQKLQFFKLNCDSKLFYELLLQVDVRGKTIMHIACEYGIDITYLLEVSDEYRDAISKILLKTDTKGLTAMHYAISRSNNSSLTKTLFNLLKSFCNSDEINDLFALKNDSCNLLHSACYQPNKNMLIIFLNVIKDNKETVENLLLDSDKDELSPLHYTVRNFYNFSRLKILLNFVNSNCSRETLHKLLCKKTRFGTTVLHMSVENFHVKYKSNLLTSLLIYLFNLLKKNKKIFYKLLLTTDNEGQTVLHYSSSEKKISQYPFLMKELLNFIQTNCSVNILGELLFKLDNNKANILHHICRYNAKENNLTFLLNKIKNKTDMLNKILFQSDSNGRTALHYTVLNYKNSFMMETLLIFVKQNCDQNILKHLLCITDNESCNVLHIACSRREGKKKYQQILVSLLNFIDHNETILNELLLKTCCRGYTPLHYAVRNFDDASMIKILLDFIKSYNSEMLDALLLKEGNKGQSLLHLACEQTKADSLKYLLHAIQDNNAVRDKLILKPDNNGQTVLHYTVLNYDNSFMMETLLIFVKQNCDQNILKHLLCITDNESCNILHIACSRKEGKKKYQQTLVSLLNFIDHNETILNELLLKMCCRGYTPLHYAVRNFDDASMIKILLDFIKSYNSEMLDALLLKEGNKGQSLLHLACEQTKADSLKYLLHAIQDNIAVRDELILKADNNGQTILHYSVCNFQMVKFFLDFVKSNCSAETFIILILKGDKEDRTGLHTFCQTSENEETLTYLLNLVKGHTTPEVFQTFLYKKDCLGNVASNYIAYNANSSSLSKILSNFDSPLPEIVDDSQLVN